MCSIHSQRFRDADLSVEQLERRLLPSATLHRGFSSVRGLAHTTAELSVGGYSPAATTVGSKALFAGAAGSEIVDVYDATTGVWSRAMLSQHRTAIAATTVGTKALFAGGGDGFTLYDTVDIYDDATGRWSTAKLSQARQAPAATSVGTKAFFAGGVPEESRRLDIYDDATDTWSTGKLSRPHVTAATTVGHLAFFAGGREADGSPSNVVDVYNARTGHWSTKTLPSPANFDQGTTVGSKAMFAGGTVPDGHGNQVPSDVVNIYDAMTGQWSLAHLSQARFVLAATTVGDKAMFAGGTYVDADGAYQGSAVLDVYDSSTGEWSTTQLAQPRAQLGATTVGDTAFFAGGYDPGSNSLSNASAVVDRFTLDSTPPDPRLRRSTDLSRPTPSPLATTTATASSEAPSMTTTSSSPAPTDSTTPQASSRKPAASTPARGSSPTTSAAEACAGTPARTAPTPSACTATRSPTPPATPPPATTWANSPSPSPPRRHSQATPPPRSEASPPSKPSERSATCSKRELRLPRSRSAPPWGESPPHPGPEHGALHQCRNRRTASQEFVCRALGTNGPLPGTNGPFPDIRPRSIGANGSNATSFL
ncbi:MAG: kelch repeat-containing protein [Phycisphaerales bacterium]|nr:kelch repeat-containing protein [Phycisphaerales bacterium]